MVDGLASQARAFAKEYVALVDALRAEGVPEQQAREEARATATLITYFKTSETGEACPLCGRGGPCSP